MSNTIVKNNYSFLPIKYSRIVPRLLIMTRKNIPAEDLLSGEKFFVNIYKMIDTQKGIDAGQMIARPVRNVINRSVYPDEINFDAFKIEKLKVTEPRQGYGKELIKYAKLESKKYNCQGRVFLSATTKYDHKNPSHIFYRKMGFETASSRINKAFDRCISENKKPKWYHTNDMFMYIPIENKKQSIPELSGLFSFLKNFLSCLFKV